MSLNGPFDPRVQHAMGPGGRMVQLQRGWIEEEATLGTYLHSGSARRVDFLFAPSEIRTAYSMGSQDEDMPLASGMDPRDSGGGYRHVSNQTLSFQLLFDRTFEVAAGDPLGVWRDAKAFLTLVGVEDETAIVSGGVNGLATGVMMFVPVWFRFGASSPLRYLAVINSLDITYALLNANQVPTRCAISISAQLMPRNFAPTADKSVHSDRLSDVSPSGERLRRPL